MVRSVAREPNKTKPKRIQVSASVELANCLERLAELGIHGSTASEVAKHFVQNEVERLIREGFIDVPGRRGKRRMARGS